MIRELVDKWFNLWETGDFMALPLADTFSHTSPYGTVNGKEAYLQLADKNRKMFLGNTFEIHDTLFSGNIACVRYTMYSKTGRLKVSEWFYAKGGLINKIVSYYNLKEERSAGRGIKIPENTH